MKQLLWALSLLIPLSAYAADYSGSEQCAGCHKEQFQQWQQSHHFEAMREANSETVLGDFNNASYDHFGVVSRFFIEDGNYYVETDSASGAIERFKVDYVFGFYPLQQYLIGFPDGRYQALSVSWDSRPKEEGGQRWYHLYPDEAIPHDDGLHWTGSFQNWNSRCATCHSTNLRKNYDLPSDTYKTSWSEINVACEACHGPGSDHIAQASKGGDTSEFKGFSKSLAGRGQWQYKEGEAIAQRVGGHDPAAQKDTCAHCHARRSELQEVPVAEGFFDAHQSRFLDQGLYHPDGQILDEVYVYDAFLQSKMHAAGVTCTNCHNPHTGKLRAEGNGVCLQCHKPQVFDTPKHHHHVAESAGAQCVNCHAPETTYMVVDPRRDHSFRIPRPDISQKLGTPNACNMCHQDQSVDWATEALQGWFGKQQRPSAAELINRSWSGDASVVPDLARLAADESQSLVLRSTALQEMGNYPSQESLQAAMQGLQSSEPALRIAGVRALAFLPADRRQQLLPLITDPVKGVRMEVAPLLVELPANNLPQQLIPLLRDLFDEYVASQMVNADSPAAQLNLGSFYARLGEPQKAEQAYLHALKLSPQFVPAMINLADFYRATGRDSQAQPLLEKAIRIAPGEAPAYHSLGLLLVRQQDLAAALPRLKKAAELAPQTGRYAYIYAVGLESNGQIDKAIRELEKALMVHSRDPDILSALAHYHEKGGSQMKATMYRRRLEQLYPGSQQAQ